MSDHTIPSWINLLHGGFLFETARFAGSHFERECALKMYYQALINNIPISKILAEARNYLQSKNVIESAIIEHLKDVEKFYKSVKLVKQKKKAWVIFWESLGEEKPIKDRIISIQKSRISSQKIAEFIEHYYMANYDSLVAKIHFSTRPKDNPYRAVQPFPPINWKLYCGNEPRIHARVVNNLKILIKDNQEEISWEEIDHTAFRNGEAGES